MCLGLFSPAAMYQREPVQGYQPRFANELGISTDTQVQNLLSIHRPIHPPTPEGELRGSHEPAPSQANTPANRRIAGPWRSGNANAVSCLR